MSTRKLSWKSIAVIGTAFLLFAQNTLAVEKFDATKHYLADYIGWYDTAQQAADVRAQKACQNSASKSGCSATVTGEEWNAYYSGYYWKGVLSYTEYGQARTENLYSPISFGCVTGMTLFFVGAEIYCAPPESVNTAQPPCEECNERKAARVGNPILLTGGLKIQSEIDYENSSGTLRLVRTYRSDQGMWRNNYQVFGINFANRPAGLMPDHANVCGKDTFDGTERCYGYRGNGGVRDFGVRRGGGRLLHFGNASDYAPPNDINDRAFAVLDASGATIAWRVTNSANDSTELFDTTGHLLSITNRNGQVTTFTYSDQNTSTAIAPKAGYLIKVEDQFGHAMQFTYFATGNMATMIDPSGQTTAYEYDAKNNLTKVTYPDGKSKTYIYDELDKTANVLQNHLLTGILDENGKRFATFSYYTYRKPQSTEHAGGVEKYSVTYPYDYRPTVTDPLGSVFSYQHMSVLGVNRQSMAIRPAASGTGTVTSRTSYDANANISSYTDFDGTVTNYFYDMTRNLETRRVEAYGAPVARTISTEWHTTFRLPTKVAEPKRITSYSYDNQGNVLTRTVQATTDATGVSGFSATSAGAPQVWNYTYDAFGHVLTAKGPRTDVNATSTFTYDSEGNLATQTNAAGHVTTYSNYDQHGRVGRITDPNGLITGMSYKPRGWLASVTVGSETTSYDYDGVGQLTQATLPDGSVLYYTYDDAHRLTRIADSLGNSINYTLDNMGNRISEQSKDVNGAMTRQVTRVMDALNRVKQITGAQQ